MAARVYWQPGVVIRGNLGDKFYSLTRMTGEVLNMYATSDSYTGGKEYTFIGASKLTNILQSNVDHPLVGGCENCEPSAVAGTQTRGCQHLPRGQLILTSGHEINDEYDHRIQTVRKTIYAAVDDQFQLCVVQNPELLAKKGQLLQWIEQRLSQPFMVGQVLAIEGQ